MNADDLSTELLPTINGVETVTDMGEVPEGAFASRTVECERCRSALDDPRDTYAMNIAAMVVIGMGHHFHWVG